MAVAERHKKTSKFSRMLKLCFISWRNRRYVGWKKRVIIINIVEVIAFGVWSGLSKLRSYEHSIGCLHVRHAYFCRSSLFLSTLLGPLLLRYCHGCRQPAAPYFFLEPMDVSNALMCAHCICVLRTWHFCFSTLPFSRSLDPFCISSYVSFIFI